MARTVEQKGSIGVFRSLGMGLVGTVVLGLALNAFGSSYDDVAHSIYGIEDFTSTTTSEVPLRTETITTTVVTVPIEVQVAALSMPVSILLRYLARFTLGKGTK